MADSILDHPIISSRYFFPQPATLAEPYWVAAADGSRLACSYSRSIPRPGRWCIPRQRRGGGRLSARLCPVVQPGGLHLLLADTVAMACQAARPRWAGMLDDVVPVLTVLRRRMKSWSCSAVQSGPCMPYMALPASENRRSDYRERRGRPGPAIFPQGSASGTRRVGGRGDGCAHTAFDYRRSSASLRERP